MSDTTSKVAELKLPLSISPSRFTLDAAFVIPVSHLSLPAGFTLDAVHKPEFLAHIAHKLIPGQRILVDAEDGSFSAQLKVHSCSRLEAVVSVEWQAKPQVTAQAASDEDLYRVHWSGPKTKWRISRNSDNATISEGHESKDIARVELSGYIKAQAA